jgi:lipooligosaccharide transport system permease protein
MTWSLVRGGVYAAAFLAAMLALGLVESPWAVLAVPAAMLTSFAFAGAGMAATTWMRGFVDFDYINLVTIPMFLFSATFFPLERYPGFLEWVVRATPLYQGVALERSLVLGDVGWALLPHVAYLAVMGAIGVRITAARLGRLLQP